MWNFEVIFDYILLKIILLVVWTNDVKDIDFLSKFKI